jgi:hypothetical protein
MATPPPSSTSSPPTPSSSNSPTASTHTASAPTLPEFPKPSKRAARSSPAKPTKSPTKSQPGTQSRAKFTYRHPRHPLRHARCRQPDALPLRHVPGIPRGQNRRATQLRLLRTLVRTTPLGTTARARQRLRIPCDQFWKEFQRNKSLQPRVLGLIHPLRAISALCPRNLRYTQCEVNTCRLEARPTARPARLRSCGSIKEGHDFRGCGKTHTCAAQRGRAALQGRVRLREISLGFSPCGRCYFRRTCLSEPLQSCRNPLKTPTSAPEGRL